MNISEKIEEIRRQPEHIRLRYVWGSVAVSMFIIILVWFFAIASMFAEEKNKKQTSSTTSDLKQQLRSLQEQSPSLKDLGNQSLSAGNAAAPVNTSDFQYPAATNDSGIPQSGTYSDLSGQ